jgi:Uma2 family endonuclease
MPERPRGRPIRVRPEWVCEVLSTSNAATDLVSKLDVYRRVGVPHYWIVDPATETLTVHRWTPDGYLIALRATRADVVRAEPFDAVELAVGRLFGDEDWHRFRNHFVGLNAEAGTAEEIR